MALARGGEAVDDPFAWWDSLSDEVVDFWQTFWRLEPWGGDWERHSYQMAMLDAVFAATINPNRKKHDRITPRVPVEFMPHDYYRGETHKRSRTAIIDQLDRYAGIKK